MPDTDSDADSESSPHRPAPQAPIRNAEAEHDPWASHHGYDDISPDEMSPSGSPSLSFRSLNMSTSSTTHHQSSASFAMTPSSSLHLPDAEREEHEEIRRDSKDVLVQRLNNIAAQLSQQDHLKEDSVNSLHTKVDEIERALFTRHQLSRQGMQRSRPSSMILQSSTSSRDSLSGPLTPGQVMPNISNMPLLALQSSSTQTTEDIPIRSAAKTKATNKSQTSPTLADKVVEEAQNLCKELESVITSLRARQEESDHIHDMLIIRAERAAQRIIYFEKRVKELEREGNECEMEMHNLRIQLKAIEVQCMSYVPKDVDEDLREGISAWKTEWSVLKQKRAWRKALADASDHPNTSTASSAQRSSTCRKVGGNEDHEIPATSTKPQRNKAAPG